MKNNRLQMLELAGNADFYSMEGQDLTGLALNANGQNGAGESASYRFTIYNGSSVAQTAIKLFNPQALSAANLATLGYPTNVTVTLDHDVYKTEDFLREIAGGKSYRIGQVQLISSNTTALAQKVKYSNKNMAGKGTEDVINFRRDKNQFAPDIIDNFYAWILDRGTTYQLSSIPAGASLSIEIFSTEETTVSSPLVGGSNVRTFVPEQITMLK